MNMGLAQIFILALCVASVAMKHCYTETEVNRKANQRAKRYPRPPNLTPTPNSSTDCSKEHFSLLASESVANRSLSPWTYVTVNNSEYFPESYSEAVCLCKTGCIMTVNGKMTVSDNYNSVELKSSFVFWKRIKCAEGGYRLKPERREVTVGCTCVRPLVFSNTETRPISTTSV